MRSIIYVSVADPLITPEDIADILGTARRNNARDALTGALIFNGHNFMQLLEGPGDKVEACLAAIRDDTPVVTCAKGLERGTGLRPTEARAAALSRRRHSAGCEPPSP